MAWTEKTGPESWRVHFRRADGTTGSVCGFRSKKTAEHYANDLEFPANPIARRRRRGRRSRRITPEKVWATPHDVLRIADQAGQLAGPPPDCSSSPPPGPAADPTHGSLLESRGTRWLGPPKTPASARRIPFLPFLPFLAELLRTHLETVETRLLTGLEHCWHTAHQHHTITDTYQDPSAPRTTPNNTVPGAAQHEAHDTHVDPDIDAGTQNSHGHGADAFHRSHAHTLDITLHKYDTTRTPPTSGTNTICCIHVLPQLLIASAKEPTPTPTPTSKRTHTAAGT